MEHARIRHGILLRCCTAVACLSVRFNLSFALAVAGKEGRIRRRIDRGHIRRWRLADLRSEAMASIRQCAAEAAAALRSGAAKDRSEYGEHYPKASTTMRARDPISVIA
jgi:hypothetical protein